MELSEVSRRVDRRTSPACGAERQATESTVIGFRGPPRSARLVTGRRRTTKAALVLAAALVITVLSASPQLAPTLLPPAGHPGGAAAGWSATGMTAADTSPACADIAVDVNDPPMLVTCRQLTLPPADPAAGLELDRAHDDDRPAGGRYAPDVFVDGAQLRAGAHTHFVLLAAVDRPAFVRCAAGPLPVRRQIAIAQLPGRALCIRTGEGRVAVVQTERVTPAGDAAVIRLTVWQRHG